jgi:hypothetical protein
MTLGDEYKTLFYGPDPDLAFSAFFVFLLFLQKACTISRFWQKLIDFYPKKCERSEPKKSVFFPTFFRLL